MFIAVSCIEVVIFSRRYLPTYSNGFRLDAIWRLHFLRNVHKNKHQVGRRKVHPLHGGPGRSVL